MAALGFMDSDGVDLGNKYVTKDYVMTWYPNLPSNMVAPQLFTWGRDNYGQLGDNTTTNKSSPIQTVAGGTNWRWVACGYYHTIGIKTDGTLWSWGYDVYGQLGDNSITHKSSPVQTISGGTTWKSVSGGFGNTSAIKSDGTLWSWGKNDYGQLGDNTAVKKSSPVQVYGGGTNWKQVVCGQNHIVAVKTDGTLWTCGYNISGQLGDNTIAHKSRPVQIYGGGTNWQSVAAGRVQSVGIKSDNTLWVWGSNGGGSGSLGTNDNINRSSPIQTIAGGTNWKQAACGTYHTAAIKTDGTLWSWGGGSMGELGDGTGTIRSSPVQSSLGGTNWKTVACGYRHTLAVKTDGTVWAAGDNGQGQLGVNSSVNNTNVFVQSSFVVNAGKMVDGGQAHSAATSEASGW